MAGSLHIRLYQNAAEANKLDKTGYLTQIVSVSNGALKEDCSVQSPVVILSGSLTQISKCNYMKIDELNRYYFITDITSLSHNLVQITARCDVLHTYRNEIKECSGIVSRTNNPELYNRFLPDSEFKSYAYPSYTNVVFKGGDEQGLQTTSTVIVLAGSK